MSYAKTAEPIDLPFGLWTWVGPRKHKFNRTRQVATMCTSSIFATWRQCARRHSVVSCVKTDESIDLSFWLWTLIGHRKHKFNRIQQVAPMCPIKLCRELDKMAEPIDLPFGLMTRVGRWKHKFNRIHEVAPMCPHGKAHWRHLANTTELPVCCGDVTLCQITLTTCYYYYGRPM